MCNGQDEYEKPFRLAVAWFACICIVAVPAAPNMLAQDEAAVRVWEYSPYQVKVWCEFDESVCVSDLARTSYLRSVEMGLDRAFGATWRLSLSDMPADVAQQLSRGFDAIDLDQLRARELVMVVARDHPQAETIRTVEAAMDMLDGLAITRASLQRLQQAHQKGPTTDVVDALLAKCQPQDQLTTIVEAINSATIPAALIPRESVPEVAEQARVLPAPLPWQSEELFRSTDKLFLMWVGRQANGYQVRLRELDCPMQFLSESFQVHAQRWDQLARVTTALFPQAFAPTARVEEAGPTAATLLLKAGGLIVEDGNPAAVRVGDVMQPIIRRNDRNGIPALLQPIDWTFAAITETDRVRMKANVYTYSNGPGLEGRRNRRTQRVLLKVRPRYQQSDIKIVVRGTEQPQAGCFVYQRDLVTDQFTFLGRTDWRGRLTVPVPDSNGTFLPDEVRREKLRRQREADALEAFGEGTEQPPSAESAAETSTSAKVANAEVTAEQEIFDAGQYEIPLNAPLTQIYIKSGETVLAKLPMVPGLQATNVAQLEDDSHRLKAEALISGFQGEIIDLIGLRNLYAAKIKLLMASQEKEMAAEVLRELRRLGNYDDMSTRLGDLQRRMLDETGGAIPLRAKAKIDRMFKSTRSMLQKYLQDDLVARSSRLVEQGQ